MEHPDPLGFQLLGYGYREEAVGPASGFVVVFNNIPIFIVSLSVLHLYKKYSTGRGTQTLAAVAP